MKSKPVNINVPMAAFINCCYRHADFTNSNDYRCSLELFFKKQEKLIEIGFALCAYQSGLLVKRLRNQIRSSNSRFLATRQVATSKAVHHTHFCRKYDEALRGLATQDYITDRLPVKESTHTHLFRRRNVIICVMLPELEDRITFPDGDWMFN